MENDDRNGTEDSAGRLVQIIGQLVEEFHPGLLNHQQVSLDSSLDLSLIHI